MALFIAAFLDFGDPMERARLEVRSGAAARAEVVEASWDRLLGLSREPAEAKGEAVTIGPEGLRSLDFEKTPPESARIVHLLIESALFEAAAGDVDRAIAEAEGILARAPDDPRATEAHLHLARWASSRGDFEAVRRHRAAIAQTLDAVGAPTAWVAGTSVALLSSLVEPVDATLALRWLRDPAAHLPAPVDQARVRGGALIVEEDPWWGTLRERLAAADPGVDWDRAFLRDVRAGDAVQRAFGSELVAARDAWTLQRRGDAWLAARALGDEIRVLAVDASGLAASMRKSMGSDAPDLFQVHFWSEPAATEETVLPLRSLGTGALAFSIHRGDPYAAGRRELVQLRLVRAALVVLALAILIASIMAARATDRARRLSLLRSTFVASVSHDLRTPIQSMLLMSETLEQNRVATEAGRQRYFGSIRREAQRLRRLVEDLLDGARIDRGEGARVERQEVDTNRYFTELENRMRERAERADGDLTFVRGALPETLFFDPDGVHRVIWNLFENALKYGRQPEKKAAITVEVGIDGGTLVARVLDEGPGIPARFASTVFQPFERVTAGAAGGDIEKDTGTGLGLAIVRAITRAHGGEARVEPSPRGAHFVATFPATSPAAH
ncbi:sensor histidine kinase [Planctomycetes bacterium Poly30]|uniref:sensor histidine kinase n=1 Tax=Saltatorellus ferox TaxID=2528018 RepID=UPI0011A7CFD7